MNQISYDRCLKRKVSDVRKILGKCTASVPVKVLENVQVFASPSIIGHRHRCAVAIIPWKATESTEATPRLTYAMWDGTKRW